MNHSLFFGALMGAAVLVLILLGLVNQASAMLFGQQGVLDTFQLPGWVLVGAVLGIVVLLLHPGPVKEKLDAAGSVAASVGLFVGYGPFQ